MGKSKVKVLHVLPSLFPGGAERLVANLLTNYNQDQFEMALLVVKTKENSILETYLEENRVKVFYLDKRKGTNLIKLNYRSKKYISDFAPQIIHTHLDVFKYIFLSVILQKIPILVHTVHNIADKEMNFTSRKIQKLAYQYLNYTPVAISSSVQKSLAQVYGITDFPLIYNGVDVAKYQVAAKQENKEHLHLINIGRLAIQKNHSLLLEAFAIVSSYFPSVYLRIVGDGPLREEIQRKIICLNLEDKVELLGIREDIPELLAQSDIFVLSSSWEGLPLVILEAMSSGLPIVATNLDTVAEVVKNEENALLTSLTNPEEMAQAIIKLVENKDLRQKIGQINIQQANQFDLSLMQKNYEELYKQLWNKR